MSHIVIVTKSPQARRQLEDQFGWDSRVRIIAIGEMIAGLAFDSVMITHGAREFVQTDPCANFWWRDVILTGGSPGCTFPEIHYEG